LEKTDRLQKHKNIKYDELSRLSIMLTTIVRVEQHMFELIL